MAETLWGRLVQTTVSLHIHTLFPLLRWCWAGVCRCPFTPGTCPFLIISFLPGGAQYDQNHIILNTMSKEKLTQVWEAMVL